jgi:hypothetical protein
LQEWPQLAASPFPPINVFQQGDNIEGFRYLEIDYQVELSWLQHRQVGRLRASQNPADIDAGLAPGVDKARNKPSFVKLRYRMAENVICPICKSEAEASGD